MTLDTSAYLRKIKQRQQMSFLGSHKNSCQKESNQVVILLNLFSKVKWVEYKEPRYHKESKSSLKNWLVTLKKWKQLRKGLNRKFEVKVASNFPTRYHRKRLLSNRIRNPDRLFKSKLQNLVRLSDPTDHSNSPTGDVSVTL